MGLDGLYHTFLSLMSLKGSITHFYCMDKHFDIRAVFCPQSFLCLRSYDRAQFGKDVMAGIIVGIIAIPLAIAFGISSGVGPTEGLVTAIVAGFLISLLGGTRVQIGGPTGAFIVIIYGIIQQFGLSGLLMATVMAGILLVAMGLLRLGAVIRRHCRLHRGHRPDHSHDPNQ